MNGKIRKELSVGQLVKVVKKEHQKNGQLTEGIIKRILTNSQTHPHGIKVELENGSVGRVKDIIY